VVTDGTAVLSSCSDLISRVSPTGSAVPTTITSSASSSVARVAPLRRGARVSNEISSSLSMQKPASITVHGASILAVDQTDSTAVGRSSVQRSARLSPVRTS
jgi:hypothetical protein